MEIHDVGFEETLDNARRHASRVGRLIVEQRARVEELRRGGRHTAEAESLLANLGSALDTVRQRLELMEQLADHERREQLYAQGYQLAGRHPV